MYTNIIMTYNRNVPDIDDKDGVFEAGNIIGADILFFYRDCFFL